MDLTVLPQLIINGIALGAPIAVIGLGMSLILNVTGRFHFAFALTYTFAAFVTAVLATRVGFPPLLAVLISLLASALLGALIEIFIYRPLAKRSGDSALLPIFVSSLGLTIAGESLLTLIWATDSPSVPFTLFDNVPVPLGLGMRTTTLDLTAVVVFGVVAFGGCAILRYTRVGQVVRAVRGNPTMARAVGIRPDAVYVWIFIVTSAAAALAASFAAARYSAVPGMGFDPLFSAFVVAFLAGSRASGIRIVIIGFALGIVQSVSTLWIPSTLTNAVVFGLLFIYLALKGTGVLERVSFSARKA